ncbi:hypothetical protein, partial [Halomonas marinisediminis]|uniref:hypothetical protein n=1 Tax=Halomonas marinisediminis TaxID=2546095 RepID=UPI0014052232
TTLSADTAAKAQQIAMLTTATQAKDDQITTLSGEVGVLSNQVQTINATANTLKSDAAQVTLQLDDAAASLIDAGNNVAAAVGGDTSKS